MIPQATDGALRQGCARDGKHPEPWRPVRAEKAGSGFFELRAAAGWLRENGCKIKLLWQPRPHNIDI